MSSRSRKSKHQPPSAAQKQARARDETRGAERAGAKDETADMESAHRRLLHLYEISKVLTRFESVERTVSEILALASEAVSLRIAIMMLEQGAGTGTRAIAWHADGVSESRLRTARAHAKTAYDYLVRPGARPHVEEEAGASVLPASTSPLPLDEGRDDGFVLLPLVVEHRQIFGALYVEGADRLDEARLVFINAVVNQLAVALDRDTVVKARQAEAEAGQAAAERTAIEAHRDEQTQRFLSETSARLAASLDYRTTLTAVVRAAVPLLADGCFVDEISEDGQIHRLAVALEDPKKERLAERLREFAPTSLSQTPPSQVLRSGESVLLAEIPSFEIVAQNRAHAELLKEVGLRSLMSVPLVARGRTIGALTFLTAESGRRYAASDLALAEEIGRRAAVAIDNAQLYERAQSAIGSRDALLAVVSHDLKNPLTTILLKTDQMLKQSRPGDEQTHKSLEAITRSAQRMTRIIGDLLDMASIEARHLALDMGAQPIAPLVDEALEMFQAMATQRSLLMERELRDAGEVVCDRGRILQVFANLIGNAIKFTRDGGSITVRTEFRDGEHWFSVTDTGPGIAPEHLPHIFDRFWQVQLTARQGTGLGLWIAKGIVEAHGGRLWAESQVGVGSAFFFTIPEASEEAAARRLVVPAAQS
jgi:signal transduction histidine kinase